MPRESKATTYGLSQAQAAAKRSFDIIFAGAAIVFTWPIMVFATAIATIDTSQWGIFSQTRVGRYGEPIKVHKIRTMRDDASNQSTVTTSSDPRVTRIGRLLRKAKIDELPQFVDVLIGAMSIVGPRPDVPGWADKLEGGDRLILSVRPGITGPASLAYRDEEGLLAEAEDPVDFNRYVIWPDKVRINRNYVTDWTFAGDIRFVVETFVSIVRRTRTNPSYQTERSGDED